LQPAVAVHVAKGNGSASFSGIRPPSSIRASAHGVPPAIWATNRSVSTPPSANASSGPCSSAVSLTRSSSFLC